MRPERTVRWPVAEIDGDKTERIAELSQGFSAGGFKSPAIPDVRTEIWVKLWGNLTFNPISALSHATRPQRRHDARIRRGRRGLNVMALLHIHDLFATLNRRSVLTLIRRRPPLIHLDRLLLARSGTTEPKYAI